MRHAILVASLVMATACGGSTSSNRIEIIRESVAADPDLEVVAADENAGVVTVRVRSTGEVTVVNARDIEDGKPLVIKTQGAAGAAGGAAAVELRGSSGRSLEIRTDAPPQEGGTSSPSGGDSSAADGASVALRGGSGRGLEVATGAAGVVLQRQDGGGLGIGVQRSGDTPRQDVQVSRRSAGSAEVAAQSGGSVGVRNGTQTVTIDGRRSEGDKQVTVGTDRQGVTITREGAGASVRVEPALPNLRSRSGPIRCSGQENLRLEGVFLDVPDGNAIVADGGCDLFIVNSHIASGRIAVVAQGNSDVTIENSVIEGRQGSLDVSGRADASATRTTFLGRMGSSGRASFDDRGGNTFK